MFKKGAKWRSDLLLQMGWDGMRRLSPCQRSPAKVSYHFVYLGVNRRKKWKSRSGNILSTESQGERCLQSSSPSKRCSQKHKRSLHRGPQIKKLVDGGIWAQKLRYTWEYGQSEGGLSPWLQLPSKTTVHWLCTKSVVGKAVLLVLESHVLHVYLLLF